MPTDITQELYMLLFHSQRLTKVTSAVAAFSRSLSNSWQY